MAIDRHRHIDERDRSIDHRKASGIVHRSPIHRCRLSMDRWSSIPDHRSAICDALL